MLNITVEDRHSLEKGEYMLAERNWETSRDTGHKSHQRGVKSQGPRVPGPGLDCVPDKINHNWEERDPVGGPI